MNKMLMTGLCFVVSKLMQATGSASEDLTKLRLATIYLHVVKISRLLFISFFGSGVCLMFLLAGLVLIHCTIFFYAPWDVSLKVAVTLICAASYIAVAGGIVAYFFDEKRWMKMFNTEAMINELAGK